MFERVRGMFKADNADDAKLADRVRREVGRVCSHPNVEVIVVNRYVTLQGPVVAHERWPVLKAARSVRGVSGVNDRMEPYEPLPTMPTQAMRKRVPNIMQRHWSPATRVLVGTVGGLMAAAGIKSGTSKGAAPVAAGVALLLRAISNVELKRLFGVESGPDTVVVQKTISIAAPLDKVYSHWTAYENFPLFMSRIDEVRDLGSGRSHWRILGPLGAPIEWNAVISAAVPNRLIAWRSEPGSVIDHAGIVQFDAENDHTRVHIRLSYNPPAGAIGHFIATVLGSNPKQEMDLDLVRMKTFIETGRRPRGAARRRA
jgi:uncharacterized membrane protein